ncbi:ScyD/ScyE family protein [Sinorhizobium numidicum]|uniref:ScyD/ScyE family protein n=1 Tax=Sinorhizobium numidicum TaxID=680248 RepID=A0ABY8CND4_9HYPH|nr:ScyD/ScyE family protein [Sinorhizobium numidicum]WEX74181.1 ScyD/ScyE family protein [Sinorhizobium numidicum]WEX80166.1 ScyD/ScyE family protein [Sinorhizobium numidicum]
MRPFRALTVALIFMASSLARAEPVVSSGYKLETISLPGAAFAGLSRDGDTLLVTDLASGRLYRRGAEGRLIAFGPIFPHGRDVIGDPTGPYRVVRVDGMLVAAQGWTPVNSDESPLDHALVVIDGADSRVISDDFWNPFDFVATGGGFYVVDSARNTIEHVQADGRKKTILTFRRIEQAPEAMRRLSPTEFKEGGSVDIDAVPTGIALRNGRLYIALFGGFPFLRGAGKIVSISEAGGASEPRADVQDLNAPVAIAFDSDGEMLVLEHGTYDQSQGFRKATGRLLKFEAMTGRRRIILDGLTRPVSVLVWNGEQLVVSDLSGNLHFLRRE